MPPTALRVPYLDGKAECYDTANPAQRLVLLHTPDTSQDGQRVNALSLHGLAGLVQYWKGRGLLKELAVYDGENVVETLVSDSASTGHGAHQLTVPAGSQAALDLQAAALWGPGQTKVNLERCLARLQYGGVLLPSPSMLQVSHLAAKYDDGPFVPPGPALPAGHLGREVLESWKPSRNKVQLFVLETPRLNNTRKNCNLTGFCIHGQMGLPTCVMPPFQM